MQVTIQSKKIVTSTILIQFKGKNIGMGYRYSYQMELGRSMEAKGYLLFVCFSFYSTITKQDRRVVQNHKLYKLFMKSLLKSG